MFAVSPPFVVMTAAAGAPPAAIGAGAVAAEAGKVFLRASFELLDCVLFLL